MIDLHLHLDGSLSLRCVKKIMKENNIIIPSDAELISKLTYHENSESSLIDYLKCFDLPLSLMQTKENVRYSVMMLLEDLYKEGVLYVEIRFAPQLHTKNGCSMEDILEGALDALSYGELLGIEAKFILCMMRGADESANASTIELGKKYLGKGVVAIDLAGDEFNYPVEMYTDLFKFARDNEVPFTIHAGEAAGPSSVENAIKLGARRIGHGIAAIEDKSLMKYIAEHNITLELCPTSNLQTRAVKSIYDYPLVKFLDAGIKVTINTDNRMVSNTTLRNEYEIIKNVPDYDLGMEKVLLNNAKTSIF